jgi:hypothetical protein
MVMMIELNIPGRSPLRLEHLVTDVNGTLALDGALMDGLTQRIASVRDRLTVHLLTADTHGRQAIIDPQLASQPPASHPAAKRAETPVRRNLGANSSSPSVRAPTTA